MSAEPCDTTRSKSKCLTSWPEICDFYYNELPEFKGPQDNGKRPRWLFRGDSPCSLRPQCVEALCPLSPRGVDTSCPLYTQSSDSPCPMWKPDADHLCPLGEQGAGPLRSADYHVGGYDVLKEAFRSRLDRAFEEFRITDCQERHEVEWGLMRAFRRKAHLHTGRRDDDWLERLGLMAHYEAPHRMLDWNYSFFNALYFAVNSTHHKGDCIIWALNKRWLREEAHALEQNVFEEMENTPDLKAKVAALRKHRACKSSVFDAKIIHLLMLTNNISGVYPVTPYYENERLSVQQGTFICAGTINETWGANLKAALLKYPDQRPLVRIPIFLTCERRKEVLRELHSMNINQATLFPDLGGFAQSLRTRLADPETIKQEIPPLDCLEI